MSLLKFPILLLGASLLLSLSPKQTLFQVISSHPHDVKAFSPYITTVKQEGRLWLVHLKENTPRSLMSNFQPVEGRTVKHYTVPNQKRAMISPVVKEFTSRIDARNIQADVEVLANFKTRLVGTQDNQKATQMIKEYLAQLGYAVSLQCYRPEACSVIADKVGARSKNNVIMIMAHMDSVGKSFAGADDNASGTAVLLEVARVLKDYGNKKTLRFFVTNGEESGLLGAKHYANVLKTSGEIKNVVMTINMDMVGYNKNGLVELETDPQYEKMAQWFAQLASSYTSLKSKITLGAWGSDHVPFINAGVPSLLTIEDWSTKTPCYHAECDKPNTLNYVYASEIAKLNLAAMMTKDME